MKWWTAVNILFQKYAATGWGEALVWNLEPDLIVEQWTMQILYITTAQTHPGKSQNYN